MIGRLKVKYFRWSALGGKHRGITQRQLAEKADISTAYLSQIELGEREGSTKVLAAIARALDLTLDDIVAS